MVDEGVPRQVVHALRTRGIDADWFRREWEGASNGRLIAAVEAAGYAVLLTNDKNIAHQQSLTGRSVAVVALPFNRRSAVMARLDEIVDAIRHVAPGQHLVMAADARRKAAGVEGDNS